MLTDSLAIGVTSSFDPRSSRWPQTMRFAIAGNGADRNQACKPYHRDADGLPEQAIDISTAEIVRASRRDRIEPKFSEPVHLPAARRRSIDSTAVEDLPQSTLRRLISGSLVFLTMLYNTMTLYARRLCARLPRREREPRRMTEGAVAAAITHEMRQPLTVIKAHAEAGVNWIERATPDLREAKAAFEQIIAASDRASVIIGSLSALYKKESLNRASLDLTEVVEEVLTVVDADLQKHGVSVDARPTSGLPPVLGDRTQLQQVLLNLISNAIDAMSRNDGRRLLSVRSEVLSGHEVMVSIADNGSGIDSQDIERIFNPLFTTKVDGMGMGLAICRSIIERHAGRLWAAPNVPHGAVFQFTLRRTANCS
jgi:signal transduction histidine kinase